MLQTSIPKLILQPLVENSLKYCERADCKIELWGKVEGEYWRICVNDNGPGFSEETIRQIEAQCAEAALHYQTKDLRISGMGLENIFIRLKLFYGDEMLFSISRGGLGGACVKIGGRIKRRMKSDG